MTWFYFHDIILRDYMREINFILYIPEKYQVVFSADNNRLLTYDISSEKIIGEFNRNNKYIGDEDGQYILLMYFTYIPKEQLIICLINNEINMKDLNLNIINNHKLSNKKIIFGLICF